MTSPNPFADEAEERNEALAEQLQEDAAVDAETEEEFEEDGDVEEVEDLDVDAPEDDSEKEVVEETPAAPGAPKTEKAPKAPARPPVAEGLMSPVAFSKFLTNKLAEAGVTNSKGVISKDNPITSQMVYSYINNSTRDGSKNPFPIVTDQALTGGRKMAVNPEEALAWWLAKNDRVAASKASAAEKAAKKAENAAKAAEAKPAEGEAPATEVVEAE